MDNMKLAILDNGLKNQTGHHYNYDIAIVDEARSLGWDVQLYAHKDFVEAPYFQDFLYATAPIQSGADLLENYLMKAALYQAQIEADVVIQPTANHTTVLGLAYSQIKASRIICVLCLPGFYDPIRQGFTLEGLLYEHAMKKAKSAHPHIEYYALNSVMATQLSSLSGIKVETIDTFCPITKEPAKPNERLTLGYFGHNNGVKRGNLIPPITGEFSDVDFLLHENPSGSLSIASKDNIVVLRGELSPDIYLNALNSCDIILMPYSPEFYKDSTSSVQIEALCHGKVMVLPHDTLLQQLAGGSGVSFHKPEVFKDAVAYAIQNHTALREIAFEKTNRMREKYSVKNYVSRLLGAPR